MSDDTRELAEELSRSQNNPIAGVGVPTPAIPASDDSYPDESPNWGEQREGSVPVNHGFPLNPMDLVAAQLDHYDKIEAAEEALWADVGRAPDDDAGKIKAAAEVDIPGNPEFTFDELVSPLSSEQIMAKREKTGATRKKKGEPRYHVDVRVFVLGGQDARTRIDECGEEITPYDDTADREAYELLVAEVLNSQGKSVFAKKTVETIQNTSKFKIFVEILRTID